VIIIICWRLIWPLVKSGAIAANPFAHIPLPPAPPAPAQAWNSLARHKVFGLIRLQLHHEAGVWTCESVKLSPVYGCWAYLLLLQGSSPTPPYPPTHCLPKSESWIPDLSRLSLWLEIPNLLQRLMWLAHKKQVVKNQHNKTFNEMKGIFVHKFGDLSANCENKLCAHTRFIRVPLYSFASCVAPKLHY
jgi:hypothetical protein